MNNNFIKTLAVVLIMVLLITAIALWRQNQKLLKDVEKTAPTENPINKQEELKLLQAQLKQLLELKESLE